MTSQPLVSIVVISYNQEAYIRQAIQSCLAQTYRHIEVVASDDASTDGTARLIREMAEGDTRIRPFLATTNRGITGNVSHALAQCRGEFVAFMGGDDFLYPEKIELHVQCLLGDDSLNLSYSRCHVYVDDQPAPVRVTAMRAIDDVKDAYELAARFSVEIPGPAPVIRRNAVPGSGFHAPAATASDWLFFIETTYGGRCQLIKEPLAGYRLHGGNIGRVRYSYMGDYVASLRQIEVGYSHDPRLVTAARKSIRRFLLGTLYASLMDANSAATREVVALYRQVFGPSKLEWLASVLQGAFLGRCLKLLKPFLKRVF